MHHLYMSLMNPAAYYEIIRVSTYSLLLVIPICIILSAIFVTRRETAINEILRALSLLILYGLHSYLILHSENQFSYFNYSGYVQITMFWLLSLMTIVLLFINTMKSLKRNISPRATAVLLLLYTGLVFLLTGVSLLTMEQPFAFAHDMHSVILLTIVPMLHYFVPLFFQMSHKRYRFMYIVMAISTLLLFIPSTIIFSSDSNFLAVVFYFCLYGALPLANLSAWLRYRRRLSWGAGVPANTRL